MGFPLKKTNPKGLERQKVSTGFHSSYIVSCLEKQTRNKDSEEILDINCKY